MLTYEGAAQSSNEDDDWLTLRSRPSPAARGAARLRDRGNVLVSGGERLVVDHRHHRIVLAIPGERVHRYLVRIESEWKRDAIQPARKNTENQVATTHGAHCRWREEASLLRAVGNVPSCAAMPQVFPTEYVRLRDMPTETHLALSQNMSPCACVQDGWSYLDTPEGRGSIKLLLLPETRRPLSERGHVCGLPRCAARSAKANIRPRAHRKCGPLAGSSASTAWRSP